MLKNEQNLAYLKRNSKKKIDWDHNWCMLKNRHFLVPQKANEGKGFRDSCIYMQRRVGWSQREVVRS
jgi:hypothetical protein